MKSLSLFAAAVLALGIGVARADTTPPTIGSNPTVDPDPTALPPAPDSELPAPAGNGSITVPAPVVPIPPPQISATREGEQPYPTGRTPGGVAILVGGGFQDFSNGSLRGMTGVGGYWNARILGGTRRLVGFEAAYVGDARSISGPGLSGNSRLMSNGLEGALRVNLPMVQGPSLLEPFVFVGLGWAHYQVNGDNVAASNVSAVDDVMTVPFGAGLELSYQGLMADARFTYHETYYNDLLGSNGGNVNNWGVGAQIGFEY